MLATLAGRNLLKAAPAERWALDILKERALTLCIAWREGGTIHFASDSRLTTANGSYADVGIKVLTIPYRILEPVETTGQLRGIAYQGELGMCFAGSTLNSLTIKESVSALLLDLQYAPGFTEVSLEGIASFIFKAYVLISRRICETALGRNGVADLLLCGRCPQSGTHKAFKFSTDADNQHSLDEILRSSQFEFIGSGIRHVSETSQPRTSLELLGLLRGLIVDEGIRDVGGNIQYGVLRGDRFQVFGIAALDEDVHYWRGSLDLNSTDFMADASALLPGIRMIDPFGDFSTNSDV